MEPPAASQQPAGVTICDRPAFWFQFTRAQVDGAGVAGGNEDLLFGRIAVHLQMISPQDLMIVTSAQQRAPTWRPLGQMLVDEGLMTEAQVEQVLAFQRTRIAAAQVAAPPPPPPAFDAIRAFAMEDAPKPAPPTPPRTTTNPPTTPPRTATLPSTPLPRTTTNPPNPFATQPRSNPQAQPAQPPASMPRTTTNPFSAPPRSNPNATPATPPKTTTLPPTPAPLPKTPTLPPLQPLPPQPPGWAPFSAERGVDGRPPRRSTDTAPLHKVLAEGVKLGASDIHMHSGARLRFRLMGSLQEMSDGLLSPWRVGETVIAALSDDEYDAFVTDGEVDFPYTAAGIGRFRCNVYKQQNGIDAVFRSLPPQPPSLAELGLPAALGKLANHHQGIVLFTGPSGCGKSATMNAILNMVNQERTDHIITIEDPTEVLHESAQSIVNQRQAKKHTASFGRALRAALREDPDVIVIGEMRDYETISLAVSAAETGHLVMGTLHTSSAIRTVSRVLGVFPPAQQSQVRSMVAESLRAIISQRLVARADGNGRVAALEILYVNQAVANLIRENRTVQIKSVLQTGQASGMCSLDMSLDQLVKDGVITKHEAARHADEPRKFQ